VLVSPFNNEQTTAKEAGNKQVLYDQRRSHEKLSEETGVRGTKRSREEGRSWSQTGGSRSSHEALFSLPPSDDRRVCTHRQTKAEQRMIDAQARYDLLANDLSMLVLSLGLRKQHETPEQLMAVINSQEALLENCLRTLQETKQKMQVIMDGNAFSLLIKKESRDS